MKADFREFTSWHTACKVIVNRSSIQNVTAHEKSGTILAILDSTADREQSYAVSQFHVTASYEEIKAWLISEK